MYALGPDGTKKWEFVTPDGVSSDPTIASDGTIYFGSLHKKLYALKPDGTKKWEFATGDIVSSPAIASDGTIYFGSWDHKLYAVRPDGTRKWEFATDGTVNASLAVDVRRYDLLRQRGQEGLCHQSRRHQEVGVRDRRRGAILSRNRQRWHDLRR